MMQYNDLESGLARSERLQLFDHPRRCVHLFQDFGIFYHGLSYQLV